MPYQACVRAIGRWCRALAERGAGPLAPLGRAPQPRMQARLLAFVSGLPGLAGGSCRSRLAGAGQLVWRAGGRVSRGQAGETAAEPRRVGKV